MNGKSKLAGKVGGFYEIWILPLARIGASVYFWAFPSEFGSGLERQCVFENLEGNFSFNNTLENCVNLRQSLPTLCIRLCWEEILGDNYSWDILSYSSLGPGVGGAVETFLKYCFFGNKVLYQKRIFSYRMKIEGLFW